MVMMVWNVSICPSLFFDEELYQWCSFLFLIFFDRSEPLITPEKFNMLQSEKKGGIWKKREKKKKEREDMDWQGIAQNLIAQATSVLTVWTLATKL